MDKAETLCIDLWLRLVNFDLWACPNMGEWYREGYRAVVSEAVLMKCIQRNIINSKLLERNLKKRYKSPDGNPWYWCFLVYNHITFISYSVKSVDSISFFSNDQSMCTKYQSFRPVGCLGIKLSALMSGMSVETRISLLPTMFMFSSNWIWLWRSRDFTEICSGWNGDVTTPVDLDSFDLRSSQRKIHSV